MEEKNGKTVSPEQARLKLADAAKKMSELKETFETVDKLLGGDRTAASLGKDMTFCAEKLAKLTKRVSEQASDLPPAEVQPMTSPAPPAEPGPSPSVHVGLKKITSFFISRMQ